MRWGIISMVLALIVALMVIAPDAMADYDVSAKVEVYGVMEKDSRPVPGGVIFIDIYVANHYKGKRSMTVRDLYYKPDFGDRWVRDTAMDEPGAGLIFPNETTGISTEVIHIPKNATVGNHTVEIKIRFTLHGDDWGGHDGEATDYIYYNFTYTINPASDAGNNGDVDSTRLGGIPSWGIAVVAVIIVLVVVAAALVLIRKGR